MQCKWTESNTMLPNQSATSSSSTAPASGSAEAADTVATMQRDGWKFFLLEWEDKITANLMTELKCIWHDVAEQCNNNPMEDLLQTTLRMAKEMEQPSYFKKTPISQEILRRCAEHNTTGRVKFTTKLLRRDENNEIYVHRSPCEYKSGVSAGVTKADQARFWAFTSYMINFNLLAEQGKKKT